MVSLRELSSSATPLSCKQLSERGSMAYRSISLALADLVAIGVVRQIGGRRERIYSINASHRLVPGLQSILRAEADYFPALRAELTAIGKPLRDGLLGVAIVGPVAVAEEPLGEPIHLVVVTDSVEAVRRWGDRFVAASTGMRERFGTVLRVSAYDRTTLRAMWVTRTPTADRLVKGSLTIVGAPLHVLVE